ncbi:MAG: radical SAM protein [Lachnospiraceae bacterium]|nr:radical SAM protein [Lachnospiraceae bacterium]
MNKYVKNLNRIEFVVTMACTGRCKHCSEGEHTAAGDHIDGDIAAKAVYDICKNYSIESLMTFGGEPLLYPEDVCKIHEAAREMNIPKRDLITNGYFSKNSERIREVAHMLGQSGVSSILLSVDAFHQETIPLEPVKEFAKCIMKEGVSIRTQPAWLVSVEDDNPYNLRTREILGEFRMLGLESASGNIIIPRGNAKKYLSEYFDENTEYVSPYDEDPKDIRTVSFKPDGDVLNGNVYKESILNILNSYSV